jgi:hypothetical protein
MASESRDVYYGFSIDVFFSFHFSAITQRSSPLLVLVMRLHVATIWCCASCEPAIPFNNFLHHDIRVFHVNVCHQMQRGFLLKLKRREAPEMRNCDSQKCIKIRKKKKLFIIILPATLVTFATSEAAFNNIEAP